MIRNGIDTRPFERPRPRGRLRRELGLPEDAPLVALFARVTPVKGIEYFLRAAQSVRERFPGARFLIVGETRTLRDDVVVPNPYAQGLQDMAASIGLGDRVIFTGVRGDVPDMLSEVSVSVSLFAGRGLVQRRPRGHGRRDRPWWPPRSAAHPRPSRTGSPVCSSPSRDAGALARAIAHILADRDLARRFGHAGRQRVAERFSIEHMVRQTAALYSNLVEERVH